MSNKKLLSEAQVKRFMGLAGLKPLNEMSHYKMDDEKEPMMEEEEMEAEMPEAPEMEQEDAADVEIEDEKIAAAEQGLEAIQDLVSALSSAVGGAPKMDMDDEAPDMPQLEDEEEELEDEEEMDQELQEVNMELTEEEIVNEVARRVAKRIVEAKRAHQKMNEALGRKTVKGARPKLRRR